ncbi:MAG: Gfo/Idh/MocA family oxidoreductase [Chloroflexi bacterium]|nr:Gfo/Idh/MocA family oxidoreductase [Chloroflexota bacterium]
MDRPLRVGVLGCGAIAQIMHIPYLVEHECFELVSLCDAHSPVLQAVADRWQVQRRYTRMEEFLRSDSLDAVIICHSGSHKQSVLAALAAGLHIFVEKPLVYNLREAEEVAESAEGTDRVIQLGYHKLYDPAFAYARERIREMRDLAFARVTVLHPWNDLGWSPHRLRRGHGVILAGHVEPADWQTLYETQLRYSAGGELTALVDEALGKNAGNDHLRLAYAQLCTSLIHQVYTMDALLGEPTRVCSCEVWRQGLSMHFVLEYPGDVRSSWDWHFLSHLKDYREEYAFFGNHDRVFWQFPSPYYRNFPSPVIIQGGQGELSWEKRVTVSLDEAFECELLAFHENITTGNTPRSSLADALRHARLIQQMTDAFG